MDTVIYQFRGTTAAERVASYRKEKENIAPIGYKSEAHFQLNEKQKNADPIYMSFDIGGDVVTVNMNSRGDKELTDEHIEYLKEQYPDGINADNYIYYVADLSCFGVIDGRQALSEVQEYMLSKGLDCPGASILARNRTVNGENRYAGMFDGNDFYEYIKQAMLEAKCRLTNLQDDPLADLFATDSAQRDYSFWNKMADAMSDIFKLEKDY